MMQGLSLGWPIGGMSTLAAMKERTPFGLRLFQARTHAKLTQTQLAKAAKVAQGTLGELEWTGESSMAVVRLAVACGVRPEWLAEGEGEMVDKVSWPFPHVDKGAILSLDEPQLSFVEGAIVNALSMLDPPNPEDLRRFQNARPVAKKGSGKRKAA